MSVDMHRIVGTHDIVMITLDTLRYDVAQEQFRAGRLPHLAAHLPGSGWELRHTPGTFTYAAHCAFFAGFLPTPASPGPHARLFALRFDGSETTDERTFVFNETDNIVEGLTQQGYRTICIGGVGFFNMRNPLGSALPQLFTERWWRPEFSVTNAESTRHQVDLARERLEDAGTQRVFLFINISAIHQPNRHYAKVPEDCLESHGAALHYVDAALAPLWQSLAARGPSFVIICSDHGTAYGEDGYWGHRHGHPVVLDVPYAHFEIPAAGNDR
ncbi:MAG TPA: STM4013/SEN3800 family hydrolase [Steroidobacter sp.]